MRGAALLSFLEVYFLRFFFSFSSSVERLTLKLISD
jgi:hypothetical protein